MDAMKLQALQFDVAGSARNACDVYGDPDCKRQVLLLGPVSPLWNGADFCRPLLDFFVHRGRRVYVLDPIAFIGDDDGAGSVDESLGQMADYIQRFLPPMDLIGGYALGGTVALKLAHHLPKTPRVLCLSGPGFIDEPLRDGLGALLEALHQDDLGGCLSTLATLVAPRGSQPKAAHLDRFAADGARQSCRRMRKGFEFLVRLDARTHLHAYPGRVLSLLGELSQLATTANLAFEPTNDSRRQCRLVPASGMRIMSDNEMFTLSSIHDWLNDSEQESLGLAG